MRRPQFTIARSMGLIAILAVNAALVRALVVDEMFYGVLLIFIALQFGLWRLPRSRGRLRRFWWGFEQTRRAVLKERSIGVSDQGTEHGGPRRETFQRRSIGEAFHILTELSKLPVAIRWPSGLKARP